MQTRALLFSQATGVSVAESPPDTAPADGWMWIDMSIQPGDTNALLEMTAHFGFDGLALRDSAEEFDLPKVDDFGHHMLVILHGLGDERVETYEVDCYLASGVLLTVRSGSAPGLDALWDQLQATPELAAGGADELVGRLADVLSRRLLSVFDAFENRLDDLTDKALVASPDLLGELTAVRKDLSAVRRVVHPQREALDLLRHSPSGLISNAGRRRFSDVFDVAARTANDLDAARGALAEILDAYRGAEAREATDVTKVLTVYAAIMLPLSLVAGFFGMNFANLPGTDSRWGWVLVTGVMALIAALSLGIFISVGWMRRPSGRRAGATLGRGLIEATRTPAQIAGAMFEISTMPLRATTRIVKRSIEDLEGDSG
jgi:magnesium transporter